MEIKNGQQWSEGSALGWGTALAPAQLRIPLADMLAPGIWKVLLVNTFHAAGIVYSRVGGTVDNAQYNRLGLMVF